MATGLTVDSDVVLSDDAKIRPKNHHGFVNVMSASVGDTSVVEVKVKAEKHPGDTVLGLLAIC